MLLRSHIDSISDCAESMHFLIRYFAGVAFHIFGGGGGGERGMFIHIQRVLVYNIIQLQKCSSLLWLLSLTFSELQFSFSQWIFRIFNVVQKDLWPFNVSFQILFLGMFFTLRNNVLEECAHPSLNRSPGYSCTTWDIWDL